MSYLIQFSLDLHNICLHLIDICPEKHKQEKLFKHVW